MRLLLAWTLHATWYTQLHHHIDIHSTTHCCAMLPSCAMRHTAALSVILCSQCCEECATAPTRCQTSCPCARNGLSSVQLHIQLPAHVTPLIRETRSCYDAKAHRCMFHIVAVVLAVLVRQQTMDKIGCPCPSHNHFH